MSLVVLQILDCGGWTTFISTPAITRQTFLRMFPVLGSTSKIWEVHVMFVPSQRSWGGDFCRGTMDLQSPLHDPVAVWQGIGSLERERAASQSAVDKAPVSFGFMALRVAPRTEPVESEEQIKTHQCIQASRNHRPTSLLYFRSDKSPEDPSLLTICRF